MRQAHPPLPYLEFLLWLAGLASTRDRFLRGEILLLNGHVSAPIVECDSTRCLGHLATAQGSGVATCDILPRMPRTAAVCLATA